MLITAALSRGPHGPFVIEPVDIDTPASGEILVRTVATGICRTDLTARQLYPAEHGPVVLGHEGAGVVAEVGPGVTGIRPGDHVLLSYRRCGACRHCAAGRPMYCERFVALNSAGRRPDGSSPLRQDGRPVLGCFIGQSSFATYCMSTVDSAVVVDPALDLTTVAPLGCGIQTGAGAVLNILRPDESSSFVVFGAGGVGMAGLLAARASRVPVIVAVDPVPGRRKAAVELGATAALDPAAAGDLVEAIVELTGGGASHALETTGLPAVVAQGMRALGTTGTLVAVGMDQAEVTVDIRDMISYGKTLRGCREGDADPQVFLPRLLDLHAAGELPLDALVTRYPFADIERAVADSLAGTAIKPVLVFPTS